jgi:membrane-associated phospholipid phosphatase
VKPGSAITLSAAWATLCAAATAALFGVAVRSARGQAVDELGMAASNRFLFAATPVAQTVLAAVSLVTLAAACLAVAGIAVARRRPLVAAGAVALVVGANLTTQGLKAHALVRPAFGDGWPGNSFPSGHTTVAASIAFALILVVAGRWRPAVAWAAGLYVGATGLSTVVMGWHRPSDAVGGILVAGAWAGLIGLIVAVIGVVREARARRLAPGGQAGPAGGAGSVGGAGLAWLGPARALTAVGAAGALIGLAASAALIGGVGENWMDWLGVAMTVFGVVGCGLLAAGVCLVMAQGGAPRRRPAASPTPKR